MISTIARTTTIFAAFALVAGASLPAAAAVSDPSAKTSEAKPAKEKRYCMNQVTTGTMLKKAQVCKTREEWIAATGQDPARK